MRGVSLPTLALARLVQQMEDFEAAPSKARTGTGSRREGDAFEALVARLWSALVGYLATRGCALERVDLAKTGKRRWTRVSHEDRALYLPDAVQRDLSPTSHGSRWLETSYDVDALVSRYPGTARAIRKYAPPRGPFRRTRYPRMFAGLSTSFDDAVVLERRDTLQEKVLLEYKTAKSSKDGKIDGNAHERLSFQVMQYLEVATRYPKCTFVVIANGAFDRYRNKYHVNFHVQADRLAVYSWFGMTHASSVPEYERIVGGLIGWLLRGKPLRLVTPP